jgi:hypothetical protein
MSVQLPDITLEVDEKNNLNIDFFLPSGILIPMTVNFHASLDLVKQVSSGVDNHSPNASRIQDWRVKIQAHSPVWGGFFPSH